MELKDHHSLERIDPRKWDDARNKLTKSNFHLGNQPVNFQTQSASVLKNTQSFTAPSSFSSADRKALAARNYKTNFIDEDTRNFEKVGKPIGFGLIPEKPQVDTSSVASLAADIKASHIEVGHGHSNNFGYRANNTYGSQPALETVKPIVWEG
jgi:hypothetical protein